MEQFFGSVFQGLLATNILDRRSPPFFVPRWRNSSTKPTYWTESDGSKFASQWRCAVQPHTHTARFSFSSVVFVWYSTDGCYLRLSADTPTSKPWTCEGEAGGVWWRLVGNKGKNRLWDVSWWQAGPITGWCVVRTFVLSIPNMNHYFLCSFERKNRNL